MPPSDALTFKQWHHLVTPPSGAPYTLMMSLSDAPSDALSDAPQWHPLVMPLHTQ